MPAKRLDFPSGGVTLHRHNSGTVRFVDGSSHLISSRCVCCVGSSSEQAPVASIATLRLCSSPIALFLGFGTSCWSQT